MHESRDILISLHARHVNSLMAGRKSVELRRRTIRLDTSARVWIYGAYPMARLQAVGTVSRIDFLPPWEIWHQYGPLTGISEAEFHAYFAGVTIGTAIVFAGIVQLGDGLDLTRLRAELGRFHPPQFFKRLRPASRELQFFERALSAVQ